MRGKDEEKRGEGRKEEHAMNYQEKVGLSRREGTREGLWENGDWDRTLRMRGLEMEKGEVEEQHEKHLKFVKLVFIPVNSECLRNKLGIVPKEVTLEKINWCQMVKGLQGDRNITINKFLCSFVTNFPVCFMMWGFLLHYNLSSSTTYDLFLGSLTCVKDFQC